MAQVKIFVEYTTNLAQFEGLPTEGQPAALLQAELHPTESGSIRIYRTDRSDASVYVLKAQEADEIRDSSGDFLVGDLGLSEAQVVDYLNNLFSPSTFNLVTDMHGATGSDVVPGDYNILVIDKSNGEVKSIPVEDTITPE